MKKLKSFLAVFLAVAMVISGLSIYPLDASAATINKTSATITVGQSTTLQIQVNGSPVSGAYWGSNNSSVASVSANGVVKGLKRGSAVITAMYDGVTYECIVSVIGKTTVSNKRYNVLILDTSSSMTGKPLKKEKEAAKNFCKQLLASSGTNYISIITFAKNSVKIQSNFTSSYSKLANIIDKASTKGNHTNINAALAKAGSLMAKVPDGNNILKNVIICSDGLPSRGTSSATGRYKASQYKKYKLANAAYKTDVILKAKDYFVYALGFFHNSSGNKLVFGKKFMKDLASVDKFYEIRKVSDINKVFKKIGNDIIKQKPVAKYTLSGIVTNAVTGALIPGATLKFRKGSNNKTGTVVKTVTSNSNGKYTTSLPAGTYTITATKTGFITTYDTVIIKAGTNVNNFSMSPKMSGSSNQWRFVLTWNGTVKDLDSHLLGTVGTEKFHVYYSNKNGYINYKQVSNLDLDDTTFYGPETTTLTAASNGIYRFYVHDYTNKSSSPSTGLGNSNAKVAIYKGNSHVATYSVPKKAGTSWYVFYIKNNKLVKTNTMSYVNSSSGYN